MAGDYTRVTFDPVKGFSGLHKQQGRVSLDWEFNEFEQMLDRRDRAEMYDVAGQTFVPSTTPNGFKIGVGGAGQLTIDVGRAYVDGILAECFGDMSAAAVTVRDDNLGGVHGPGPVDYNKQPFFYQPGYPVLSAAPGTIDLVYLDVWQREVTVFEDPSLREVALNGPDTATRVQTAWQVKVLQNVPATSCATPPPAWTALTAPSTARITAGTTPVAPAPGPCVINPAGGYTGLENRLYRVEIHKAGTVGGATKAQFKWSRDNASLAARVLSITSAGGGESIITVASTGRDAWMRFEQAHHIELLDDHVEWAMRETGIGGSLATIKSINHATGEIRIDKDLSAFAVVTARHPRIRRWDIASAAEPLVRDVNNGTPIPIEEGITITFGDSGTDTLHAGDYITFAARTADGTIELVDHMPPRGVLHHFMRLALVTAGTPPVVVSDCRVPPSTTTPAAEGCCTKVVHPGESIQAALDALPAPGGCVCLKVGDHPIQAPIVIRKSNVSLHGESIGARVLGRDVRQLLTIGDFTTGSGVTDVVVHDIRFETAGGPQAPPERDGVIAITASRGVAIHDCEAVVPKPFAMSGIVISDSRNVSIDRNIVEGPLVGVSTIDDCERISVRDNTLTAFPRESTDLGIIGVSMIGVIGACDAARNHIEQFVEGIRLTQVSGADGSRILGNVVVRRRPPTGTNATLWGIDVAGAGTTVRDNDVTVAVAQHGGIHAQGTQIRIDNNGVHGDPEDGAATGILLEGAPGQPVGDGLISGNRLRGRLRAIAIRGCMGGEAIGNDMRLGRDDTTGIEVHSVRDSLVASNVMSGAGQGISVIGCSAVRVMSNQIDAGVSGIMAVKSTAVTIGDNAVDTMSQFGISTSSIQQVTTVSRNKLVRCCLKERNQAAIFAGDESEEIVVEFNDVIDTGVVNGALIGPVRGIHLHGASRSRVQGNHVFYTNPAGLKRDLEARALLLESVKGSTSLGGTTNNWALILDNRFSGIGLTALVEILGTQATPLQRLTFSQNYCEHFNQPNDDRPATVSIAFAALVTVQGNQTKADPRAASFDFHRFGSVTFMGNVGFGIRPPLTILPPLAQMPAFNIVIP